MSDKQNSDDDLWEFRRRLLKILKPEGTETALLDIELAQVRMKELIASREETARERRMVESLRSDMQRLRALLNETIESVTAQTKRLNVALADAEECRRLRDEAIDALGRRTTQLLNAERKAGALRQEVARLTAPRRALDSALGSFVQHLTDAEVDEQKEAQQPKESDSGT